MANKLHESLSALMDNEADDLELRRILKDLESLGESDKGEEIAELLELKAKWHRYHVVSACLKQEIHTRPSRNLLTAIQAELEQDAAPSKPITAKVRENSIFRSIGQGAIAASVALAVLFTADMVMVADVGNGVDAGAQIAGNTTTDQFPGLTGDLNPATATRVAVQNGLNPEEMDRLQQVVSQELEDAPESREVPATFNPDTNR